MSTQTPALSLPLQQVHVIQASAGTGKTWTLAALVVRLLVEGKRPCEQIIATTFTRAAAAEMRERIRNRIVETKTILDKILSDTRAIAETGEMSFATIEKFYTQHPQNSKYADLLSDPVNEYIIDYLLKELNKKADEKQNKQQESRQTGFEWASRHLELTLINLDKMFVGTLDSLCQKLMREFSLDLMLEHQTSKALDVVDGDDNALVALTSDALRMWRYQLSQKNPQLLNLLASQNKLGTVDELAKTAKSSINYISLPIEPFEQPDVDLGKLDSLTTEFRRCDHSELEAFMSTGHPANKHFLKAFRDKFISWPAIQEALSSDSSAIFSLDSSSNKFLENLNKESVFKKAGKSFDGEFDTIRCVQILRKMYEYKERIDNAIKKIVEHQRYFICHYVHTKLADELESKNKTTFSLQMRQLHRALQNDTSQSLIKQIRHRYPVALIDEFQDVNADQAGIIYQVYQHKLPKEQAQRICVLLVGDPKQAIYGFRGGDIDNYHQVVNRVIKDYPKNIHTLDTNRRSQVKLIEKLNEVFGSKKDLLENVAYEPVHAFGVKEQLVDETGNAVNNLLRVFNIGEHNDDLKDQNTNMLVVAHKIRELLSSYSMQDGQHSRALQPSDIAVLYRSKKSVHGLQKHLHSMNIPTFTQASVSVFDDTMAQNCASILKAMLSPQRTSILCGALIGVCFALTKNDIAQLLDNQSIIPENWQQHSSDAYALSDFQFVFSEAGRIWQQYGVLSAFEHLATQFGIWQRLAQQDNGERLLIDLRQILDILQDQAIKNIKTKATQLEVTNVEQSHTSEQMLLDWVLQQLQEKPDNEWALQQRLPSATGVEMMTIHKSKGLEFPIVFVIGVDTGGKFMDNGLYLVHPDDSEAHCDNDSSDTDTDGVSNSLANSDTTDIQTPQQTQGKQKQTSISFQKGEESYNQKQKKEREYAESLRVTYVAFTRPSQLLYVVAKGDFQDNIFTKTGAIKSEKPALAHWLTTDSKEFNKDVAQKFISDPLKEPEALDQTPQPVTDNNVDNDDDTAHDVLAPADVPEKLYFRAWKNTSFSALARDLDTQEQQQAEQVPEHVMEAQIVDKESSTETTNLASVQETETEHTEIVTDSVRFIFPKGANAGSFLHKVFEKLDFAHQHSWHSTITSFAKQFGITQAFAQQYDPAFDDDAMREQIPHISDWIQQVLHTPLLSGTCLADIPVQQRLPEMGFSLGLGKKFTSKKIGEYMQKHGFGMQLPAHSQDYNFLKGEIDLVYEHNGKYYVLDYKSNFLGTSLHNYTFDDMQHAMNHAGYWLQASLYMVALHRYLKVRLANYDIHTHLGGVEYAFIRGMHPESVDQSSDTHTFDGGNNTAISSATGVIGWQPSAEFVIGLDAILAKDD